MVVGEFLILWDLNFWEGEGGGGGGGGRGSDIISMSKFCGYGNITLSHMKCKVIHFSCSYK